VRFVKALVQSKYGPAEVLSLQDVDVPVPGEGGVLVRVEATSVNPADWHFMKGEPYIARMQTGLRAPKWPVLGCDVAGVVEAVGPGVTGFEPGSEVFGSPFMRGFGAFAELAVLPADALAPKPSNLSFPEAAVVPLAALTALQGLRDHGGVVKGQRVLVLGASGGVGTFAVQIAKALGAIVIGVCSTANLDLVRSLGADTVVDYTREDLGEGYEVILQLGGEASASDLRRRLTAKGTLVLSSGDSPGRWLGPLGRVIRAGLLSPFVGQTLGTFTVEPNSADLATLREYIEAGAVRPVVSRTRPLSEVPDAIALSERGHTRGKVAIEIQRAGE
jgi:NADPH:quinone reductase-like Zn-dependent oxidoreductase